MTGRLEESSLGSANLYAFSLLRFIDGLEGYVYSGLFPVLVP